MNPWFTQWPQDVAGRRAAIRPGAPVKRGPMKTVETVIREGNYPARFLQIIPFTTGDIPAGGSKEIAIKLDEDFPYRLDAFQAQAAGFAGAASFCEIAVLLPSGRNLTRRPVGLSGFCGVQGGKSFVHFRYRFQPADQIVLVISNTHPTQAFHVSGVAYGYKLPTESRL